MCPSLTVTPNERERFFALSFSAIPTGTARFFSSVRFLNPGGAEGPLFAVYPRHSLDSPAVQSRSHASTPPSVGHDQKCARRRNGLIQPFFRRRHSNRHRGAIVQQLLQHREYHRAVLKEITLPLGTFPLPGFPAAIGWKAHTSRLKFLFGLALQSRAGEVCTATAQTPVKGGSFLYCWPCLQLLSLGLRRNFSPSPTSRFRGGWMLLPAWLSTARSTPYSTNTSGGTALCANLDWHASRTSRDAGAVIS